MGWDEVRRDKDSNNDQQFEKMEFVQFPEGATQVRIVDKEPFSRWKHWIPQNNRSYICPGKGCPVCNIIKMLKRTEKCQYSSQKGITFIIDRKDGKLKILENSKTFLDNY